MSYKRNQIEEAIARISIPKSEKPPSELRTRIKRLLELDRSIGRKLRSKDAEQANFAFFSEEAPGTGADISFSEYEAFALLNGLRIMGHGWPQGFAVAIMRRVRRDLEREHARILRQDPDKLFDWEAIRAAARPGDIAVDNTDPVFLTLASKAQRSPDEAQTPRFSAVCRGYEKVSEIQSRCGRLECDYVRGRNARAQATPRVDENGTKASRPRVVLSSAAGPFSVNSTSLQSIETYGRVSNVRTGAETRRENTLVRFEGEMGNPNGQEQCEGQGSVSWDQGRNPSP